MGRLVWPANCENKNMSSIRCRDGLAGIPITSANALLLILLSMLLPSVGKGASLEPAALGAGEEYLGSAQKRMEERLDPGNAFIWVDEAPDRLSTVRSGQIVVSSVGRQTPKRVPQGLIHDWIGAVFIEGVTLPQVMHVVRDYARYKELYQPTVASSKVLPSDESKDRFSMLL